MARGTKMNYTAEITNCGKRIIETDDLQRIVKEPDYNKFYQIVINAVEKGVLEPVKASKTNGMFLPLYNKYKIKKPEEDMEIYLQQIRKLSPYLNISGYLENVTIFKKHMAIVSGLSDFLWRDERLLKEPMSINERSFSIWGKEKFLKENKSIINEILKFNGLDESYLNFYNTPEPFFEYIHSKELNNAVLVLENKDTWFTMRRIMQETGKNDIYGERVDVLLYGEGSKISKPEALQEYIFMMLGNKGSGAKVLYFGDLDLEGIHIFNRVRRANPELDIKPFSEIYRLMLNLARGRNLPLTKDKRELEIDIIEFEQFLCENSIKDIKSIIETGKYIPQEIVNYQVIMDLLK
jgi:hypothetical protein